MRGKAVGTPFLFSLTGITPAYAGKSRRGISSFCGRRDHPRVCGEKLAFSAVCAREMGSPPRVRGKDMRQALFKKPLRITPAYAGKSVSRRPRWTHTGDHPRACGEKVISETSVFQMGGSPPRMRGKATVFRPQDIYTRITPAHAGKSRRTCPTLPTAGDHPRACGEKISHPPQRP